MTERFAGNFQPFVIPFLTGMVFVLAVCLRRVIEVLSELDGKDRRKYLTSFFKPKVLLHDILDISLDSLLHVRLWKRNPMLGFMHSSIAFGWFMLIVLGHVEVLTYLPEKAHIIFYPIFFDYFIEGGQHTFISGLMDFFLVVILAGILLAIIKRFHSRVFGMKRTARPSLPNLVGLISLWTIFPLRLAAELFARAGNLTTVPWWAYSAALCVFMVVLPFSRYLHIPAEMFLITLRNAGLSASGPGRGMARVQADSCPNCGLCIDACPMNADTPNIRCSTVYFTRQLRRKARRKVYDMSDKCLLCGKCSTVCQVGIDGATLRLLSRSSRRYNIGADFSNAQPEPIQADGRLLYFGGCMTQLTPRIGRSVESLLRKAGISYDWMDRDGGLCCGRPLHTAGRIEEATSLSRKNEELILGSGARTLLVSCPICYREFRERYSLPSIRIVHYADYFLELLNNGRLKLRKEDTSYVYHDPCELGRGCGIYDSPRELLSLAARTVEAPLAREASVCCGGSLGSLSLDFGHREKITLASLENLYKSGAEAIATACPLCLSTFSRYSNRPVKDISEIINEQTI